mgnify:CR=1 FL=1
MKLREDSLSALENAVLGRVIQCGVGTVLEFAKNRLQEEGGTLTATFLGNAVLIPAATSTDVFVHVMLYSECPDSIVEAKLIAEWRDRPSATVVRADTAPYPLPLRVPVAEMKEELTCPVSLREGQVRMGYFYFQLPSFNLEHRPQLMLLVTSDKGQDSAERVVACVHPRG